MSKTHRRRAVVAELRTGGVAVIGSESCANLHDRFLSWEECEPLVVEYCEHAGLPSTAGAFTMALKRKRTAMAAKMDAGYVDNADLTNDQASGKARSPAPRQGASAVRAGPGGGGLLPVGSAPRASPFPDASHGDVSADQ